MNTKPLVIEACQLTKKFGRVEAVSSVGLEIPEGTIFALVGQNGAGKTTLMKLLLNIIAPTSGSAHICGAPVSTLKGRAFTRIGYVSEDQELPEWMTVRAYMNYLRPFYPQWDDENLLSDLKLPPDRKLKHLSRGMRMKAALASVLAFRPPVIFMDEPFSGLDPLVRDELIETLIGRVVDDHEGRTGSQTTIFISSHDLAEVESFATHVGFLNQGKLLFAEPMSTLIGRFRQVTVFNDFHNRSLPPVPDSWLVQELTPSTLHFVHTQADYEPVDEQIRKALGNVTAVESEPMTLRTIFLALVKSSDQPNWRAA